LRRQAAALQARLTAGDTDQLEVQNADLALADGELALLDARAGAAGAAGQLEDALQTPPAGFGATPPPPGQTLSP